MIVHSEILINNKIKAYHLKGGVYITKCGKAYKVKLNGNIVQKKLDWNIVQYRINIDNKIAPFAIQMLKLFKPELYKPFRI